MLVDGDIKSSESITDRFHRENTTTATASSTRSDQETGKLNASDVKDGPYTNAAEFDNPSIGESSAMKAGDDSTVENVIEAQENVIGDPSESITALRSKNVEYFKKMKEVSFV
jgi:uncharacterized protein with FMN-binding domain